MKFHEPKNLALLNASLLSGALIVILVTGLWMAGPLPFSTLHLVLLSVLAVILLFVISYLLFLYTLKRFIVSKLRLVYKSIHTVKTGKEGTLMKRADHLIDDVQEEVERWKAEKLNEIEHLKQLEQYRRDFLGNVAHELKTPLFNIQGYVSTLLDGGLEDPSINREYLKRTGKSVERLVRILEDLDEITQLESGHMQLRFSRFDLVSLTREVAEMLEMKAGKHAISLVVNDPGRPVMVEGDKDKIRQVLTNIVDNSIRYGGREGGKTKVTFFDMDEYFLTEVTDDGIGIDAADLPRVFERFYRTGRGRAATKKGKGLGLAIVKHILEAHGQTVNVRSTVGVGTTFGFTLKKA
ncbi:MAG TPA: ATP-binding protein [Bacteroidales bacterium]|nr:ATP-binding protein [Bacteroidales bacterium]HPS62583.1 ATP-binding protein [Bacteroidales bacterium]